MSRVAIAVWNKRISPVFDVSRKIFIYDLNAEGIARQIEKQLPEDNPLQKAACLRDLGVDTLICGAISRPLAELLGAWNIRLLAFTTGDLHRVLEAYVGGRLPHADYTMPGCCRRRQARQGDLAVNLAGYRGRRLRGRAILRSRKAGSSPAGEPPKGGPYAQR